MKKLIVSICTLAFSAIMLCTSTYAWFSMNKTVTASGMQVKAQAEGSIVITSGGTLPADGVKTTDYNFNETASTTLFASTHSTDYTNHPNGLKRVGNAENINLETGTQKNSAATLNYESVSNSETVVYYRDYTVYIAGDGQAFSNQTLTITLSGTFTEGKTINKAVSVDFYGLNITDTSTTVVSSDNYLGTLNLAGKKNNDDNNGVEDCASLVKTGLTIPQTGKTAAYAVTMRVYYDGALIETGGTNAYTAYKAATGTAEAGKYYYTDANGTSVASVASGASVSGLYVVDSAASTYTYARTVDSSNLDDVKLKVTFVASTPA